MKNEETNKILEVNNPEKRITGKEDNKLNIVEKNILKSSDSSTGDIITKINREADDLDNEINSSNLKVFEKYHNLSVKELQILLMQKNDNILNLNDQKEKYKKTLNEIIKKLNLTISKNTDILYYDNLDEDLFINLERTKEEKKKELENSKKINKMFKNQLESIKDKLSFGDKEKKKMNLIEIKINNLKEKNLSIKNEINNIKIDKLKHKKDYELVVDNKKFLHKIKIRTEEMNNFSGQKQGYFTKLNTSMKSLDNVIKELKRLEEIYNASINEEIEENFVKKINYWINLLKTDLEGEKDEIISRIENGKSLFLNKIVPNKNDLIEKYSFNPNKINFTSNNENVRNIIETENLNNNNISSIKNNKIESNDIQSKLFKNRIKINKNKSSSLILANITKGNITSKKENDKIKFYMKNNQYTNGNFNYNLEYKTLFRKLNYLKLKSPLSGSMKLKLNNINNLENNYNKNSNYNSEEISSLNNNIKSQTNKIELNSELLLSDILTKDYNEITNADYRELLVKKEQYLQQNLRLEKNIEDIQKTKNKKLINVLKIIEENAYNLEHLKNTNDLLKKEIQNLINVQKLRFEQAKLESEIQQKRPNIKKIKLKSEQNKIEEINKLSDNDYYKNKLKEKKNNKIDYFDEIFKKKNKNAKSANKIKENINENQSREEKLKIIKEKYKKGNTIDDSNDFDISNKNKDIEKLNEEHNNNNIDENTYKSTEIKVNINETNDNGNQDIKENENINDNIEMENI